MHRTPLYDLHCRLGARMVDFAGWEMPLLYTGIIEEHNATRERATFFDVSHMGRIEVQGSGAENYLERLCTRPIGSMKPGQCRYGHICREDGGILDDVIVSRLNDRWLVVCNASNREKILSWFEKHRAGHEIEINDQTFATAMLAIQGPEVREWAQSRLPAGIVDLKRYHCSAGNYMGIHYVCSRTGYTGEDGYEIIVSATAARTLAGYLVNEEDISRSPIRPAGLGSRDTLRLEAGMPLYGHELSEQVDSLSAGQAWAVDLDKDFIGAEAMRKLQQGGLQRTLVGLELDGRRIARPESALFVGDARVGEITSGTLSPTLQKVIAMGYVQSEFAEVGRTIQADIRGARAAATVVPMPFYRRKAQESS